MSAMDEVLGTILIASWVTTALLAVEFSWALRYYRHFSRQDGLYFKILVAVTLILGLVSLLAGHINVYLYCVSHWGDVEFLAVQYWPVPLFFFSGTSAAAIVQGFLVLRYIRLSKNWYIGSSLMVLVLATLGSGFATAISVIRYDDLDERPLLELPVRLWLIMDVVADVSISSALIYEFLRKRTGLKTTNTLIRRLIVLNVQSATLPAFCAIASLIAFVVKPATNISPMFAWSLPQFYILSLLYTLNVRESIQEGARSPTPRIASVSNFTIGGIHAVRTDVISKDDHSFVESSTNKTQMS